MATSENVGNPTRAGELIPLGRNQCDSVILLLVGSLMTLGAVMVYSASVSVHAEPFTWRNWWNTPLRQSVFALVGFFAMVFVSQLDYRIWKWEHAGEGWWVGSLYLLAAVLLVAMLIPGIGSEALGARRAIVIMRAPFPLSFQPAELAKVVLIVWLAAILGRPGFDLSSFKHGFVPLMASAGLLIGLTGIEDYGTAALMGAVTLLMFALAGARWHHLAGTILLGGGLGALLLYARAHRMQRILTFFSDEPDTSGAAYQVTQSLIAIGSGGWWGRGLGNGVQKLGYLPQDNNDFIFAIVCEELGIAGGVFVIAIFLLLLARGWWIANHALDRFGRLLATGITLMLCLQAAFNIGVVTNSVPTKGISLPFVSAGGSGVLFLGAAAGLLAAVGGSISARRS